MLGLTSAGAWTRCRGPIYRALLRRRWLSRLRGVRSTRSRAWRRCCLSRRSGRPRRRAGWTSFDGWCRAGFLCRALRAGSSQGIGARRAAARRGWFRYLFLAVWRLRRGALCFGASGSATCSRFYLLVGIWGFRCVGHEEDPLLSSDTPLVPIRTRAGTSPRPYPIRLGKPLRRRVRAWACPRPGTLLYKAAEISLHSHIKRTVFFQLSRKETGPRWCSARQYSSALSGVGAMVISS